MVICVVGLCVCVAISIKKLHSGVNCVLQCVNIAVTAQVARGVLLHESKRHSLKKHP